MAAPIKVKYSTGGSDIGNAKDFPWEYGVPDNDFWNDLDWHMGQSFLSRFSDTEIEALNPQLDASLPKSGKLDLLRRLLREKLVTEEAAVAPKTLIEADNPKWRGINSALGSTYRCEGNVNEELKILKYIIANSNASLVQYDHYLASLLEATGQYEEAIELARPILKSLDSSLGPDSPQAHGSRRTIAMSLWKLGKKEEAEILIKEIQDNIVLSAHGKFAEYQVEEQRILDEFTNELQKWDQSTTGGSVK